MHSWILQIEKGKLKLAQIYMISIKICWLLYQELTVPQPHLPTQFFCMKLSEIGAGRISLCHGNRDQKTY